MGNRGETMRHFEVELGAEPSALAEFCAAASRDGLEVAGLAWECNRHVVRFRARNPDAVEAWLSRRGLPRPRVLSDETFEPAF